MPLNDARKFVAKMRDDRNFRNQAQNAETPEHLTLLLNGEGLLFDQGELVGAMAECMAQMEEQAGS